MSIISISEFQRKPSNLLTAVLNLREKNYSSFQMKAIEIYSVRLARFLKEKRKQLHLTQEKLSEYAGIDYKHIQRLESPINKNDPRLSTLLKLANALKITPEELLKQLNPAYYSVSKSDQELWMVGEDTLKNSNKNEPTSELEPPSLEK